MKIATGTIWVVTATVRGNEFKWTGRATCGETARDRCLASAKRVWNAAMTITREPGAVSVSGVGEAHEDYPKSRTFLRAYGLKDAIEAADDLGGAPSREEIQAILGAVARTEMVLSGFPDDLDNLTLGACSGTQQGPNSLVPIASTSAAPRIDRPVALSNEANAMIEIACVAHMAWCVTADKLVDMSFHRIAPSQSHTLRAAIKRDALKRYDDDCALLSTFARRHGDDDTAESYKAFGALKWVPRVA